MLGQDEELEVDWRREYVTMVVSMRAFVPASNNCHMEIIVCVVAIFAVVDLLSLHLVGIDNLPGDYAVHRCNRIGDGCGRRELFGGVLDEGWNWQSKNCGCGFSLAPRYVPASGLRKIMFFRCVLANAPRSIVHLKK
ncbi:hypothetical protein VFPPC_15447 [Pochonia chlamydosporia 170]|uniref:Uncharacterized protein n=1 Tax=Pochonia chlamydosporia 170 TaxID=1380566 RepID=A0A179G949_METCM|nr:hypothetical protein VFPPC_15447 [Pochonia chlamydosporia 170]OAQ74335.1 hypothetical protein VFPPC_15447 [Pochonia chlamydosporia 170]